MAEIKPFEFKQCVSILKSIGRKAKNLQELREGLAGISDESIFHHTYQYFLRGRLLEYTNDFAQWAGEGLEERALAEYLSNIDPYSFKDVRGLRNELLNVIDRYLSDFPKPREAMRGDEFYFNEAIILISPVGIQAKNLAEFLMAIKYVEPECIYFHFYEARIRPPEEVDDFSNWFEDALDKRELANKVRAIDPFMHSLEETRRHLIDLVEKELRTDMERF